LTLIKDRHPDLLSLDLEFATLSSRKL
jgi:hypothetical protein